MASASSMSSPSASLNPSVPKAEVKAPEKSAESLSEMRVSSVTRVGRVAVARNQ